MSVGQMLVWAAVRLTVYITAALAGAALFLIGAAIYLAFN